MLWPNKTKFQQLELNSFGSVYTAFCDEMLFFFPMFSSVQLSVMSVKKSASLGERFFCVVCF